MLWGILFWSAIVYLAVSPDKTSLAASRGFWGAVRGFAKPGRTSSKNGRPGAAQGPRGRFAGLLDGWREGIRVARQRRANGKDLWSRGSYIAGRAWGASESIRAGVRRIPAQAAARRAERAAKKGSPTVQGEVIDPDPMTDEPTTHRPGHTEAGTTGPKVWVCAVCALSFKKKWSERPLWAPYRRMRVGDGHPQDRRGAFVPSELGVVRNASQVGVDVDANQRCHFCTDRFGQLYPDSCPDCEGPEGYFGDHSEENEHRRGANAGPCPQCGIHHLGFGPREATSYDEGCSYDISNRFLKPGDPIFGPQSYTGPDNGFRHHLVDPAENPEKAICGVSHLPADIQPLENRHRHEICDACCPLCRRRVVEEAEGAVAGWWQPTAEPDALEIVQGEVIASTTTKDLATDVAEGAPAEGAGAPSTTTTKPAMAGEENPMSINTTELESLDAVAAEVERAQQMTAALAETLEATKAWAQGLIDRWGGTDWGTDEIDTGVSEAADAVSTLGDTEPLDAALRSISTAVHNARSLAEVADQVGAKGSIDAFRAS